MSHKRKSRSIIGFPMFKRHVEVKSPKETSRINLNNEVGKEITNLCSESSEESRNKMYEEKFVLQEIKSPTHSYSTTGSDLEGLLDLSTKLSGLSSGSSLSWSEDYELEITKKVQLELEKLDKAFQGIGDVPPPQDEEEIAEWKHFFPKLCILGEKTPTNSADNSEASSESEDETPTHTEPKLETIHTLSTVLSQHNNSLKNKRKTEEHAQNFINASRSYHTLPLKLRSLEIEKYLKISSIKSPVALTRKQNSQPLLTRQESKGESGDVSPQHTSLPYLTATPLKTQIRKPPRKASKLLSLPPIASNFRSISATPRQASSKSMFAPFNFEKNSSARGDQIRLRSDLMKLFDFIPVTNR